MKLYELEHTAAKTFSDYEAFWKAQKAFTDDFLYFQMYMKRHTTSNVSFTPAVYSRSLQSLIDCYSHDEQGLERAYCIYCIMKQIILDFLPWREPILDEEERNKLLRYFVKYEYADLDIFCKDFIDCSSAYPEVYQNIKDALGDKVESE